MRAIHSDGRVRTFRSQGEVVIDDRGKPIRVVGIVQDITDAKLTHEALQNTSADLERRATELQQLALRTATEAPAIPHATLSATARDSSEGTIKWHVRQILAKTNSTCDGLE
jgi:PAS domain-containing protein